MAKRICQLASVCDGYCTHRWPHDAPKNPAIEKKFTGCHIQGCNNHHVIYTQGLVDEDGQQLSPRHCNPAYCVDFDYWLENTGPGHLIVSKGTVIEGCIEHRKLFKIKEQEDWESAREAQQKAWEEERKVAREREEAANDTE